MPASLISGYPLETARSPQKSYDRKFQWELHADLTVNADTNGATVDNFTLGWWLDQTVTSNYTQFVHGLYFNNYWFRTYEKGSNGYLGKSYTADTEYEAKLSLTSAGAEYSVLGGAYSAWTLLKTLNTYTDQVMRIAVNQYSHNATIHSLTVTPVPLAAALGGEIVNVRTSFGYPWVSGESNLVDVQTPAPVAPSDLIVTAISDSEVNLTWLDNTDAETRFEIERCQGDGCGAFAPLGIVAGNVRNYQDTGLVFSTSYSYRVRAYKAAFHPWFSLYSAPASDRTFPQSTSDLNATALNSRTIKLTWLDLATDEDGYEIEVQAWNGKFIKTGRVYANETSYIDTVGIEPEQLYTYRIRPYRGNDKSPYSNEAEALTPPYVSGDGTCLP